MELGLFKTRFDYTPENAYIVHQFRPLKSMRLCSPENQNANL